ncbi:uncharacterized protein L969DRAFT_15182 [Mixia osmundae IAM 14324]|uniref:J domain-containing protein n=1 Tax=Mixia osmundae (strain CBS 9802 / IAM 14324 / JCM 22182 / KY 12970) TaxID=764103 RepID=G7DXN6_MIXOS|nr:uncharacterized protein L969DRAFT_15182 [Mixia osmundae IAM 14324]KEI41161.1 hypothetical protein L969DRAFT_15182 [Mixia osmundae IAM 14324]GAA95346.1 hypothetical protein E5Q_02003 [Mixia osmundae IAM 14324]
MSSSSKAIDNARIKAEASLPAIDAPDDDGFDIDKFLNAEASSLAKEQEVMRVIRAFKLNPYAILDLPMDPGRVTDDDIRKTYRKKSLMIHPDKFKHPQGIEAFDKLKKASTDLLTPNLRASLDVTIKDARMLVLRALVPPLPRETPDDHPVLRRLRDPPLNERISMKTKEILIDEELRRRRAKQMTMIAEGAEAKRVEEAQEAYKRKTEDKKKWEDTREGRVQDWRSFQSGGKKKKQKLEVLG